MAVYISICLIVYILVHRLVRQQQTNRPTGAISWQVGWEKTQTDFGKIKKNTATDFEVGWNRLEPVLDRFWTDFRL